MFNAYTLHPVATKLPLVVESVTSYERTLLGGAKNGSLVKYTANQDQHNYGLYVCKNFSKKSVSQLKIIVEHQILIALSGSRVSLFEYFIFPWFPKVYQFPLNGLITVHDCQHVNYPVVAWLQKVKGANFFAAEDITNPDKGNKSDKPILCLCVVVRRKILIFYWLNREFVEFTSLPDVTYPDNVRSAVWCCGLLGLAVRDEYYLLNVFDLDSKDEVAGNTKFLFTMGNKSVEPVITPLNDRKIIGFSRDETMVFVTLDGQSATRSGYVDIRWSQVPNAVEYDSPFVLALFSKSIEVRSLKPSQLIQTIDIQKPEFLSFSYRCCLYVVSHPVANLTDLYCLDALPTLKSNIQICVREKQYDLAVQMAENVCDEADDVKSKRVNDIKHLNAFHLYCQRKFEEAMDLYGQINAEVVYVVGLFPDLLPDEIRKRVTYPGALPTDFAKNDHVQGLQALSAYLSMVRTNIARWLYELNQTKSKLVNKEPLTDADKKLLIDEKSESQQRDLLKIVDTTLLKCYLQTNDMLVASLLRLPDNSCDVEESEKILMKFKKFNELFLLYERKQMHAAALELLKSQAKIKDSPLKGLARTVHYLQNLGNENLPLIFKYAKWVLSEDLEEGLRIFTEECEEVLRLDREKVFDFLMRESPKAVVPYLEHVITQWNDKSSRFHLVLLEQIILSVKKEMNNYVQSLQPGQSVAPAGKEPGNLGPLRTKLLNYLEFSSSYNPELLIVQLPHDSMFEERALILGRLHQHKQAIAIYTNILHEPKKAESYCKFHYNNATQPEDAQVFLTLLAAYAQPPDSNVMGVRYAGLDKPRPNVSLALKIFQEYAPYLDTVKALALFPTSTRWKELWIALSSVLQEISRKKRDVQMRNGLFYSQDLTTRAQKMKGLNVKVVINNQSTCSTCGKKIGASAFARLPNQSLVHYYCISKE